MLVSVAHIRVEFGRNSVKLVHSAKPLRFFESSRLCGIGLCGIGLCGIGLCVFCNPKCITLHVLQEKVRQVEIVLADLDAEIRSFQGWSKLYCPAGCGKCCFKADIEATVLEFLPFAWHLYTAGQAEAWREKLLAEESPICVILNPTQSGAGLCSEYAYRGLICRLFGYSARLTKYRERELVTCQVIKTEQTPAYEHAVGQISEDRQVPVMSDYYFRLQSIDGDLTRDFYPINTAIRKAIETVLHYFAYR
jgi:Fe-S-cluster containining protein